MKKKAVQIVDVDYRKNLFIHEDDNFVNLETVMLNKTIADKKCKHFFIK